MLQISSSSINLMFHICNSHAIPKSIDTPYRLLGPLKKIFRYPLPAITQGCSHYGLHPIPHHTCCSTPCSSFLCSCHQCTLMVSVICLVSHSFCFISSLWPPLPSMMKRTGISHKSKSTTGNKHVPSTSISTGPSQHGECLANARALCHVEIMGKLCYIWSQRGQK